MTIGEAPLGMTIPEASLSMTIPEAPFSMTIGETSLRTTIHEASPKSWRPISYRSSTISYSLSIFVHHDLKTQTQNPNNMKKLFVLAAIALPLLWTSCGDKPEEIQEEVIPQGMVAVDLSNMGHPVKINAPDSASGIMDTMATPNGIQVRVGSKFDLLVNIGGPEEIDLAQQKTLIDFGTNTFTVNDATTLVWETKYGEGDGAVSVYHFYTLVKVGEDTYYVRDNNTNPDNQFKKEDVDRMLEAAKSLRTAAKPVAEPEA